MKKTLNLLLLLLLFFSCQQEESTSEEEARQIKTGIVSSVLKAGNVKIGKTGEVSVLMGNATLNAINPNVSIEGEELTFSSATNGCTINSIPPNTECSYRFHFSPLTEGSKTFTINIYGESLTVTGTGVGGAKFTIFPTSWAMGDLQAGARSTKTFMISNTGSELISVPTPVDLSRFSRSFSACPIEGLKPGTQCEIEIKFKENYAGQSSGLFELKVSDTTRASASYSANVYPGPPSGLITFRNCPTSLEVGDELEKKCDAVVTDEFGNAVLDGNIVNVSARNANLEINDQVLLTKDGQVTITFSSGPTTGEASFTVTSDLALGTISIPYTSGPAVGDINLFPFNNSLRADGTSSVILRTQALVNENGDLVDDGTEVTFEIVEGEGKFQDRTKKETVKTVNGEAFIKYTVGNSVGVTKFKIYSNPLYDQNENLLGYAANGEGLINVIASAPSGSFEIQTAEDSIYYETGDPDYNSRTSVVIGPITDENGDFASLGQPVQVSIHNGVSDSGDSAGQSVFEVLTGEGSIASFFVRGIGIKGPITIRATLGNSSSVKVIQSVGRENYKFNDSYNKLKLFKTRVNTNFSPNVEAKPYSSSWFPYEGKTNPIEKNSGNFLSETSYSRQAFYLNDNYPYMSSDCIQSVDHYFFWSPCTMEVLSQRGVVDRGGSARSYTMFYNGKTGIFRSNGNPSAGWVDFASDATSAFGTSNVSFVNSFYLKGSDRNYVFGGLKYPLDSPDLTENKVVGVYAYPSQMRTNLDSLSYEGYSSSQLTVHPGLVLPGFSNEGDDGIYFMGGISKISEMKTINTVSLARAPVGPETLPGGGALPLIFEEKRAISDPIYGLPATRFKPVVHYAKNENMVYVLGGYAVNSTTGLWEYLDEIWSFEATGPNSDIQWFLRCKPCNLPDQSKDAVDHLIDLFTLDDGEDALTLDSVAAKITLATDTLSRDKIIYDPYTKENYYFSVGKTYKIDLVSGSTVEIDTENTFGDVSSVDDIIYNPVSNRYLLYEKGNRSDLPGRLKIFDAKKGEKTAFMVEVSLRENSKEFARKLDIQVNALAESSTNSGLQNIAGIQLYAYNFLEEEWILMDDNQESSNFLIKDRPMSYLMEYKTDGTTSIDPRAFINDSGKHYLMIVPSESPGYQGTSFLSEGESTITIEFIQLREGVF